MKMMGCDTELTKFSSRIQDPGWVICGVMIDDEMLAWVISAKKGTAIDKRHAPHMHPSGRLGAYSQLDMVQPLMQEIFFSREFGHVHSPVVVKVEEGIVLASGRLGEFWRQGNMIMMQQDVV